MVGHLDVASNPDPLADPNRLDCREHRKGTDGRAVSDLDRYVLAVALHVQPASGIDRHSRAHCDAAHALDSNWRCDHAMRAEFGERTRGEDRKALPMDPCCPPVARDESPPERLTPIPHARRLPAHRGSAQEGGIAQIGLDPGRLIWIRPTLLNYRYRVYIADVSGGRVGVYSHAAVLSVLTNQAAAQESAVRNLNSRIGAATVADLTNASIMSCAGEAVSGPPAAPYRLNGDRVGDKTSDQHGIRVAWLSSRTLTPGSLGSSFNKRWISSLSESSFDGRPGTETQPIGPQRRAYRVARQTSAPDHLLDRNAPHELPQPQLPRALHVQQAFLPASIDTTEPGSTSPRTPPHSPRGSNLSRRRGGSVSNRPRYP